MLSVQLLVEGRDEENFLRELARYLRVENIVSIESFEGKDNLRRFLSAFINRRGFLETVNRIGIVRDADDNFSGAFDSVCNSLEAVKLPVPKSPEVFTTATPSVGVMILPGKDQNGMLETLLCRTISDPDVNNCIDKFFECLRTEANIDVRRAMKARARVFLATRPDPHLSVGVAAQRGYWDLSHEELNGVRDFLRELVALDQD